MKVIVFGATGMVGHGVLRECLLADDVEEVLAVTRSPLAVEHAKLRSRVHDNFADFTGVDFAGYDACFFCLGVSSVGMSEADYRRVTYDYALAAVRAMPADQVFVYVSGAGTDTNGRQMWQRVKGRTEDDVIASQVRGYAFRPGFIRPMHGARSKVWYFHALYVALTPLSALLVRGFPGIATTTERLGRAMLRVARDRPDQRVWDSKAINAAG
ncbi:epimerase [Dactylosporangium sp. AC04546]|uniref:epimerase n=1 Tax=Dactylosporangium sp. AC04546 TaxID=2862460 RepID=UPI001EDE4B99|nr:epimerase [Dactylosporangium sp. AC04546]WVK81589.1 epimerase [Dactylosporangium sp. AC04546]